MPIIRALVSALTFFGGHLLNRRLDRVVQILGLLALVAVVSYVVVPQVLFRLAHEPEAFEWLWKAPQLLILVVAIASAAITWLDARLPPAAPLSLTNRLAGAVATVFGFALLSTMLLAFVPQRGRMASSTAPQDFAATEVFKSFHASAHLGGRNAGPDAPEPPSGKHTVRGRIVLDGRGVADAEVRLRLNEEFETDRLATDDEGLFETSLPPGPWRINGVSVVDWDGAPADRDLLLFSDLDPLKTETAYSRHDFGARGLELQLPLPASAQTPTFYLRDALEVAWPERTNVFLMERDAALPEASIAQSTIRWTPVAHAVEYEVQISALTREQNSTSYSMLLRRRLSESALALASLPQRTSSTATSQEYLVEIYAFDAGNRLISETSSNNGELVFRIEGVSHLAEERTSRRESSTSAEHFKNLERLSLVSGLLEYKQLAAAKDILAAVTQDAPPGRKAGLEGSIAALEGRCAEARALFHQADAAGGIGCAPPKYRKLCDSR
jgi:hypothetical protein